MGCLGAFGLLVLWLLLLALTIADAIPYGGSNRFVGLWLVLTWAVIIFVGVIVFRAIVGCGRWAWAARSLRKRDEKLE